MAPLIVGQPTVQEHQKQRMNSAYVKPFQKPGQPEQDLIGPGMVHQHALGDLADLSSWLPLATGTLTAGLILLAGRFLSARRRPRAVDPGPLIDVAFGLRPPVPTAAGPRRYATGRAAAPPYWSPQ